MEPPWPAKTKSKYKSRKDDLPEPNVPVDDDNYLRFGWWTTVDEDDPTEDKFPHLLRRRNGIQQR